MDIIELDKKIISLLSQRAEKTIQNLKEKKKEAYSPEEKEKLQNLIHASNNGPLEDGILMQIFNEMETASAMKVLPITVAYLGPEGTFTGIAIGEFFGESVETLAQKTISDVFRAVEAGDALYGVVPVENSTEGAVTFTLDELIETDLNIISERFIKISYYLLSINKDMDSIKKIYSHPQAVGQCKGWLRKNMPNSEIITVNSNSYAAELSAKDVDSAGISTYIASEIYGLNILANKIEDSRQNYTRFFLIGRQKDESTGNDKTSIVCAVKDKPGALLNLLKPFSDLGLNMTKIESRPDKKKMWAYNFFIDFLGHKDEKVVQEALDKIREDTIFLKILGSYPIGT